MPGRTEPFACWQAICLLLGPDLAELPQKWAWWAALPSAAGAHFAGSLADVWQVTVDEAQARLCHSSDKDHWADRNSRQAAMML